MWFTSNWHSEKTRRNRARAARKPRVRWEVLGLPSARETGAMSSIEDIRRQGSHMANGGLAQRSHPTE
jgi:hypothetical protein